MAKSVDFFVLLTQAAEISLQASQVFRDAMHSENPASYVTRLKELEDQGDQVTHEIYKGLNKVFITPIDREDIMELASSIDTVLDGIEATIARFDYLNIQKTDDFMRDFSAVFVQSCQHILDSMKLLSAKKYMQLTEHTVKINTLENEGDRLMREGIRQIFINQQDPYTDFKLKEIYERMEETTDACEDVANILDSVVLKYA